MEGIQKIMNSVKVMRFKKDDILIVKLKNTFSANEIARIREQVINLIPKEFNVKVIFSSPDIDFEIIRKNTKECTQVIASDNGIDNKETSKMGDHSGQNGLLAGNVS